MDQRSRHNKEIRKRIGTMLLSLVVAVSMMPVFAFADDTPEQTEATVTETGQEAAAYPEAAEEQADTEADAAGAEEPEIAEEPATAEEAEPTDDQPDEEDGSLDFAELETARTNVGLKDTDELLSEYIDNRIKDETGTTLTAPSSDADSGVQRIQKRAKLASRFSVLNANEKIVYEQLKEKVRAVAEGRAARTDLTVTYYTDVDYITVLDALILDMPYEFYWYDKTGLFLYGIKDGRFLYLLNVSKDYENRFVTYGKTGIVCGVDVNKTRSTKAAVDNVSDIINEFADKSDLDKLYGYRNRVCEFASYDREAVKTCNEYYDRIESGLYADPFYGDPWQLIHVFDDDESTKVVCEGYSKAFQYLCNRTDFADSEIECHTVGGDLYTGTRNLGGHMWNIIHMGNGGNYIADITNSDNGSFAIENYFLKGYCSGNVSDGYTFSSLTYVYDEQTFGGYEYEEGGSHIGMYTEQELTLSNSDYDVGVPVITHVPARPAACTVRGNIECWLRLGYYYSKESCTEASRLTYSQVVIKDDHGWSDWETTKSASCTTAGTMRRSCSKCGKVETKAIPAYGHAWKKTRHLDSDSYKCSRCGDSYNVSRVIVDRPKVTIKKPVKRKNVKGKATITVKWKKLSKSKRKKISGIEIQYSTRKNFASSYKVTTAKKTAVSKTIKKLKRKKTYYIRIRTYKKINGKKHVSKWSAVKKIRTK